MRDIVSEVGTFFSGVSALPVLKTTQTSPAVALTGYDGAMIYILSNNWTDGTFTPVIQVTNDNGSGVPNAANWTAVPVADLVLWQATSTTNFAPVKVGNSQPAAISSAATAINQRVGYIGYLVPSTSLSADWLRVVSTISGGPATGMGYDVIILLGRPRLMPANV
jgi:hypothetical protein